MGLYNRGRPNKTNHDGIRDIPNVPGESRIRDKFNKIAYIGETNNLKRRAKEHSKSGKFDLSSSFEYKIANESSSSERRAHEQRSIKKHRPYLNKSHGGEGRPAINPISSFSEDFEVSTGRSKLQKVILVIKIIAIVVAVILLFRFVREVVSYIHSLVARIKDFLPFI